MKNYQVMIIVSIVFFLVGWQTNKLITPEAPKIQAKIKKIKNKIVPKKITLLEKIDAKKRLDVIILNSPTVYYMGNEREIGFEYELISNYAESIGVDLNLTTVYTISDALEMSRKGIGDITVASITLTPERKKEFKFGPQYYTVQEQLICHKNIFRKSIKNESDLVGVKITVGKDTSYESTMNSLKEKVEGFEFQLTKKYSTGQLLELVNNKKIDCTVADSNIFTLNQRYYPELSRVMILSDRKALSWILRKGDNSLNESLYKWLNIYERSGKMAELRDYYYSFLSLFDYYDTKVFYKRLKSRLPKYRKNFKAAGKKYNIPWMLLAAQSYQESHWNAKAKSHTGVRGIMMITQSTAKSLGVKNRLNAKDAIYGGAKYLRNIEKRLDKEIKGKSRWYFTLAAYNVGMGHIHDAQSLARKLNKNPYTWSTMKEVLPLLTQKRYYKNLKYGYARGNEPIKYVNAIQRYLTIIMKNERK